MLECRVAQEDGTVLHLKGRLDGLGAPALQKEMELLVQQGHRTLQLDLGEVDFLSSAGLRVLLTGHRQLKAIGGKVLLRRLSAAAREVLVISGFEALFNLGEATGDQPDRGERHLSLLGHRFQVLEADAPAAPLHAWGNAGACERAAYVPEDVQPVPGLDWGLGLAALGRDWAQVRDFFGETVFLDGHAFVYPAIPHSAVDFVYREGLAEGVQGLYGWGFNGGPRWTLGFETPMELAELCQALLELSDAPAFGLVLLGESDGLCGLNLRRSPVECGDQAVSLFEADQFPQWLDFPVEPEELHARVAAVGFIHREPVSPAWRDSLPARTPFHVHGLVCTKGSLSRDPALFRSELERLVQTTEPRKVQHLLGQSRFKAGLVAVTELKLEAAAAHL